jgi:hypothetical protein
LRFFNLYIMFMCLDEVGCFMVFARRLRGAECNDLCDRHTARVLSEEPS